MAGVRRQPGPSQLSHWIPITLRPAPRAAAIKPQGRGCGRVSGRPQAGRAEPPVSPEDPQGAGRLSLPQTGARRAAAAWGSPVTDLGQVRGAPEGLRSRALGPLGPADGSRGNLLSLPAPAQRAGPPSPGSSAPPSAAEKEGTEIPSLKPWGSFCRRTGSLQLRKTAGPWTGWGAGG